MYLRILNQLIILQRCPIVKAKGTNGFDRFVNFLPKKPPTRPSSHACTVWRQGLPPCLSQNCPPCKKGRHQVKCIRVFLCKAAASRPARSRGTAHLENSTFRRQNSRLKGCLFGADSCNVILKGGAKTMQPEKIGDFLASLRKSKGFTQQEVAEQLNLSNKTISKWESGVSHN